MDTATRTVNVIIPEVEFQFFVQVIQKLGWKIKTDSSDKTQTGMSLEQKKEAFEKLRRMIRHVPELDDDKELMEYLGDKYDL